jgi:23S rRNA (pseudouridine1915-N3)-methyltransferase
MFKVKVITQGKLKESWLSDALAEYEKRLSPKMKIEWVLVDSSKELITKALQEPSLIALDLQGKALNSVEFSRCLFTKWGSRPSFAIGGAEGLSPEILRHAKYQICLSNLTFTHQMVRLILVEQLYRATEIEEGSSYHK